MAVEIRHSRTATLVDSPANPGYNADELQADDWNAVHPITADGMGLLFANSAGAVAETMTVDTGTVTASTPFTFKQSWSDPTETLTFRGVVVDIQDQQTGGVDGGDAATSAHFRVQRRDGDNVAFDLFEVSRNEVRLTRPLKWYPVGGFGEPSELTLQPGEDGLVVGQVGVANESYAKHGKTGLITWKVDGSDNGQTTFYGADQIYSAAIASGVEGAETTLTTSPLMTALAQWANLPTNTDIADGYSQVGVDTNTGDIYLAANVGGTIFKVQLV